MLPHIMNRGFSPGLIKRPLIETALLIVTAGYHL